MKAAGLLRILFSWFVCGWIRRVGGKVVFGLVDRGEMVMLDEFCFTIEDNSHPGRIHSETIVDSSNHNLLIFKDAHIARDLLSQNECSTLIEHSRVVEQLLTDGTPQAYELNLTVDANMAGKDVAAVVTQCGGRLSLEYRIEFLNPGGIFRRHFSCHDQGVFQLYLVVILPLIIPLTLVLMRLWTNISFLAGPMAPVVTGFFLSASFFGASCLLTFFNIFLFSLDGLGITIVRTMGILCDSLFNLLFAAVLLIFAIGDRRYYLGSQNESSTTTTSSTPIIMHQQTQVARPFSLTSLVARGSSYESDEHSSHEWTRIVKKEAAILWTIFALGLLFASTIALYDKESLFLHAHLTSVWSIPYLLVRVIIGAFLFKVAKESAYTTERGEISRTFFIDIAFLQSCWFALVPLAVIFPLGGSRHLVEFFTFLANILAVTTLLRFMTPSKVSRLFGNAVASTNKLRQSPPSRTPSHTHFFNANAASRELNEPVPELKLMTTSSFQRF